MPFFDTLKNLVTEQVEVPDVTNAVKPATISNYSPPNYTTVGSVDTNEIDKSIKSKFEEALANNTPPLYTELNDTVSMLAEDIPNVASRYKAAIKVLTKRGATSAAIVSAFDICLQVIDKRRAELQSASEKKIQEKIGGKKSEIELCDKKIDESNNQIAQLNAQIQMLQKQMEESSNRKSQLQAEIVKDDESIKLKQSRLEVVYKQLFQDFTTQKQNLLDYSK